MRRCFFKKRLAYHFDFFDLSIITVFNIGELFPQTFQAVFKITALETTEKKLLQIVFVLEMFDTSDDHVFKQL